MSSVMELWLGSSKWCGTSATSTVENGDGLDVWRVREEVKGLHPREGVRRVGAAGVAEGGHVPGLSRRIARHVHNPFGPQAP